MAQVWKFPLAIDGALQPLNLRYGSEILTVQMQDGVPFLWAIVWNTAPHTDERYVRMLGTGWDVPAQQHKYIATVQDGPLVWHFFEVMS